MHIEYLARHAGRRGLQGGGHPDHVEATTGPSGATRCSRRTGRRPATAIFGIGQPLGVDSSDSFYSFLTFMDAYNVKLVERQRQAPGRRPDGQAPGLISALTDYTDVYVQGLLAAVVDELEGPGQQRRLLQQDDGDDAQRDDLDRRQVARRRQQRGAHRRAARDGEEELRRADRAPRAFRTSPTARKMVYRAAVKTGVDLRQAPRTRRAPRSSSPSCSQEENLTPYVEGSLGRWFPVTKAAHAEPVLEGRPAPPLGLQPVREPAR